MVITRFVVTDSFKAKIHAAVESQLLEHVVVETLTGVDEDPSLAWNAESDCDGRFSGSTPENRGYRARRYPLLPGDNRFEEAIVVELISNADT
ncbi:unannotated protein [freshwater metagenome]|uniref:Unannotated protein n=1 Tax=freshwater metagenome TaxID=449393 RepID=A0A6J7DEM9_9ZZZZ